MEDLYVDQARHQEHERQREKHAHESQASLERPGRPRNLLAATRRLCPWAMGSLLAVVVGQALLANGQVRLSALQNQLTLEQSSHRQAELAVSGLETPSRIVASASAQLHMVRPTQVTELPYVSLTTPLPTPKVTPGPAPAPSPVTTPAPAPVTTPTTPTTPSTAAGAADGTAATTTTSTP